MKKHSLHVVVILSLIVGIWLMGCTNRQDSRFISSAVVEATTWQVATSAQGTIVAMSKDEGQNVSASEVVAIIDTVPLVLKRQELAANSAELSTSITAKRSEIAAQISDVAGLKRNVDRIAALAQGGSATLQQKEDITTQYESAQLRVKANNDVIRSFGERQKALMAGVAQLNDQINRCYVRAPHGGVVLTRYRNTGEVVAPAAPLFEIGAYDTVYVDFFVPQTMLSGFSIGQRVDIRIDTDAQANGKKFEIVPASISWIGNDAEFSPKNIQTRETRNELVFRIRAIVPNKGDVLKRGLPVEVLRNE